MTLQIKILDGRTLEKLGEQVGATQISQGEC